MKIINIIICILLVCCISSTIPCYSKNIEKSIPVTEFDKDVQMALKLLHKDLYSLIKMHDKNMQLISQDITHILEELKSSKEKIKIMEIRLELLENQGINSLQMKIELPEK